MTVSINPKNYFDSTQITEYVKHRIYDPVIYHRNFTHDLPKATSVAKRAALIALPFLCLHKPFGTTISLTMGGVRCVTHITEAVKSVLRKEKLATLNNLSRTALAVVAVTATICSFRAGLLTTSIADAGASLTEAVTCLRAKDYPRAMEALLEASSSMFYLSFMLSGTLEVMLASILVQGAICLYRAHKELHEGKYPEALAKIAMGVIRFNQAYDYFQMIQKKNTFLKLEKFAHLLEKIKKGRKTEHLINSPLHENKKNVVMLDGDGKEYNFGTHFHGSGKGLVKGMNLQFRTTQVDGKNIKDIDFKVNHVFRDKLESLIEGMKSLNPKEIQDFLALTQSHAKGIRVEVVPFQFCQETKGNLGTAYKVTLEGLGQVFIGNSADLISTYDYVRVQIDENKSIYELHEMLTFFNLDDAIRQSSSDDIERLKIGQLFRIFFPKEATILERTDQFFELSLEELKAEIIKQVPEMQQTMDKYLGKMQTSEILPGRLRYALPDIAKMAYELGARALISTIKGTKNSQEACDRVVSILKMGMNSSETRYRNGITKKGLIGGLKESDAPNNFYNGGSDSVYTQMLTKNNFENKLQLEKLLYSSVRDEVRLLFSLEALNSGTYQYHADDVGTREVKKMDEKFIDEEFMEMLNEHIEEMKAYILTDDINSYELAHVLHFIKQCLQMQLKGTLYDSPLFDSPYISRSNIFNFIKTEQKHFSNQNEVMLKERIDPSMITGIVVSTDQIRDELLSKLRAEGIVKESSGIEKIFDVPVDRFIHVTERLSDSLLA